MKNSDFRPVGSYPAIVTPFCADGSALDRESFVQLLHYLLSHGADGIVVCGSTGEGTALSGDEYRAVVELAAGEMAGRAPCVAGISVSSTARACELGRMAASAGADALLVVAPPYNKPSQEGMLEHFRAVRRESGLAVIAYNVPGRTSSNLLPATAGRLAGEGVIAGIKEASGSMDQIMDLFSQVGDSISVMAGDDSMVLAIMAAGGKGVISTTANLIPEVFRRITDGARRGHWEDARKAQFEALPVVRAMFMESNPVPVKAALEMKKLIRSGVPRLPLLAAREETRRRISELGVL